MTLRELLGREAETVAEVGVYTGKNAARLRREFPGALMWLVDPWSPNNIARTYEIDNSPEKWARVERECRARFRADRNVRFLKMRSHEAVGGFKDKSLDVIFLDAGREYPILFGYLGAWLPKLAPGGVIAGKGLAGNYRGDVELALKDKFGSYERLSRTGWAVKIP